MHEVMCIRDQDFLSARLRRVAEASRQRALDKAPGHHTSLAREYDVHASEHFGQIHPYRQITFLCLTLLGSTSPKMLSYHFRVYSFSEKLVFLEDAGSSWLLAGSSWFLLAPPGSSKQASTA